MNSLKIIARMTKIRILSWRYEHESNWPEKIVQLSVVAFKLYICISIKLNPNKTALFQRPIKYVPSSGPWYDDMVLGVRSLSAMMKNISKAAQLAT